MRNPKSSTTRKVRSRRISTPPARHATTTCRRAVESETSPTQSKSRITHYASRTRNGKVARLPYPVRDMINRMLRNNIPHSQIVDALDELQFKVTERNISNWKTRGGYRDWCIAQDRALETRLLQDNLLAQLRTNDASQLAEVGLQLAATQLSQFFLKPETREQLTAEPEKLARTIGILCRLARQIHILQKYRDQSAKELGPEHNPELFKRENDEFIENLRDTYSAEKPAQSINEPGTSHRNFLPKNGYPADPPDDTPEDHSHIDHNIELFEASIAAARAKAQSQFSHQTSPPGSAAPKTFGAASSDSSPEPELSDAATPADPESPAV